MYAILSPKLLHIFQRKPVLLHMIAASTVVPVAMAIGSAIHTARFPYNLMEISKLEPYPHFPRNQRYFKGSGSAYEVKQPIFDHDYNLIGYS